MKLLTRYTLRKIIVPAVLALVVVAVLGVANEIQERTKDDRLPIDQMTVGDISKMTLYFLPTLVPYVIPITFMLGLLLTFGRLAQNNETVAMKAAGIPMKRMVLPIILLGTMLSIACFGIQDRLQPWAISRLHNLLVSEVPLRLTLNSLPTGIMQEFGDWRVYIRDRDRKTNTLFDVVILNPEEDGHRVSSYYARTAQLITENGRPVLELKDGHFIPAGEEGQDVMRLKFPSMRMTVPRIEILKPRVHRQGWTMAQLLQSQKERAAMLEEQHSDPVERELRKEREEIADRLSLPFACMAVTLAAAPLGARAKRSGRSYTFAAGFLIILAYYVLDMIFQPHGLQSLGTYVLMAWIPNIVLSAAGVVFLWRVDRV